MFRNWTFLPASSNSPKPIHMADPDTRYRLVVLGASRTGKSSIIHMFLNGKFLDTYKETVEDLHYREFTIDDKTIKVDILDTAGKIQRSLFDLINYSFRKYGIPSNASTINCNIPCFHPCL